MKRLIALSFLVLLVLCGCSKNPDLLKDIPAGNLGDPSRYTMPTGKYYATGDQQITITLSTSMGNLPDNDDEIWDKIASRTGVRVNIQFATSSIVRGNMMVSKSDISVLDIPIVSRNDYIRENSYFIPLSSLVKAFAPNLDALLNSKEHIGAKIYVTDHTSDDHQFYAIPSMVNNATLAEQFVIRSDLLEKYGPECPKNANQLFDILNKINGENGKNTTLKDHLYPLVSQRSFQSGGYNLLFTLFDCSRDVFTADGQLYSSLKTQGYKDTIKFLKKLYSDNMLLKEFCFGMPDSLNKPFYNGQVGVGLITESTLNIANKIFEEEKRPYKYVKMPLLKSVSGRECLNFNVNFEPALYISSYSKHPIECLRLIDWFYSDEAKELGVYGFNFGGDSESDSKQEVKKLPTIENSLGFSEFPFLKLDKSEYSGIKSTGQNSEEFIIALYDFITGKRDINTWNNFVNEYADRSFFFYQRAYFRYVDMYAFYNK